MRMDLRAGSSLICLWEYPYLKSLKKKKRKSVIEFLRSKQFPIVSEGCMLCYIMLCNAPSLSCSGIRRIAPGRNTNMWPGWCSHLVEGCNHSCLEGSGTRTTYRVKHTAVL